MASVVTAFFSVQRLPDDPVAGVCDIRSSLRPECSGRYQFHLSAKPGRFSERQLDCGRESWTGREGCTVRLLRITWTVDPLNGRHPRILLKRCRGLPRLRESWTFRTQKSRCPGKFFAPQAGTVLWITGRKTWTLRARAGRLDRNLQTLVRQSGTCASLFLDGSASKSLSVNGIHDGKILKL